MFTHVFAQDLQLLTQEFSSPKQFAFVRFGDGERALLTTTSLTVDKPFERWASPHPDLQSLLNEALTYDHERYFVGISCPCCDPDAHNWYQRRRNNTRTTFANLFVNSNHEQAFLILKRLMTNAYIVSSAWGSDLRVPRDATTLGDLRGFVELAASQIVGVRQTVLVAAGPLGKAIIYRAFRLYQERGSNKPYPKLVDIGSALDPVLHGAATRAYHDSAHANRAKVCQWSS